MDYGVSTNAHQLIDILIIDDDRPTCDFLSTLLTAARYTVLDTQRGSNALALIQHYQPRLVMIDIHMPDWHGLEFAQYLSMQTEFPPPAIILMSAKPLPSAVANQTWAYVEKPFDIRSLLQQIDRLLHLPAAHNPRWIWHGT
ncbi:PleD family two-component system response regulator [Herpetosiphon sp. NSE202]|uniref:response regulator n=1 Tax=Herpetosiphon sp. NSE202 TaxID=3351349 RepID=UPI0036407BEB